MNRLIFTGCVNWLSDKLVFKLLITRYFIILVLFFLSGLSTLHSSILPFKASPDQVLVLYNEDYETDVDGSEPGQDSLEVADYYVRMHTDPVSGKKPYLLGLKCVHGGKHLNNWVIEESSNDNTNGVVFKGKGKGPGPEEWERDSRFVEIVVNPTPKNVVDWNSVTMFCGSEKADTKVQVLPKVSGVPKLKKGRIFYPDIQEGKGRCFSFNAKSLFSGTVQVYFKAKDIKGHTIRDLSLTYYDHEDFEFSILGRDNVSDELHFQEDVAIPVKKFLENEKNRLPDGTSLKEHILYIVVCHGLPFSCEGVFGLKREAYSGTGAGDLGSLEQRLQTLYYGWGKEIRPPVASYYFKRGPDSEKGVKNYRITTAMRHALFGNRWNPYMHPDTYNFEKTREYINILPFPERRKGLPSYFFAYAASRIDGTGPEDAKRQIDYAVYASRYLRPEMDARVRKNKEQNPSTMQDRLTLAETNDAWGEREIKTLGFNTYKRGMPFLGRPPEDSFLSEPGPVNRDDTVGYYPGGFDRVVVSGNGWNMGRRAPIWNQVKNGVTVSACGGPAYGDGPHITNATFWDNAVLMRYLFRGRDLGECFLLSTCYVNWATSLVGDPLFHPELVKTAEDTSPPVVSSKEDIKIRLAPAMGGYAGTLDVAVRSSDRDPEVAMLKVVYYPEGRENQSQVSFDPMYSSRPRIVLRNLLPNCVYVYKPLLIDPYGNMTDVTKSFGPLLFKTPELNPEQPVAVNGGKKADKWRIRLTRPVEFSHAGTIEVAFTVLKKGGMPGVKSKDIQVGGLRPDKPNTFHLGGACCGVMKSSPLKPGDEAVMVLRWRKFPLTRELVLKSKNGDEFSVLADVRTPWEKMIMKGNIYISDDKNRVQILSVTIVNDALPASQDACAIEIPPIDPEKWKKS